MSLIEELKISNALIASSLSDHNDAHKVVETQMIGIALGVTSLKEKTFYLLTIVVIALALLAGAEKILAVL